MRISCKEWRCNNATKRIFLLGTAIVPLTHGNNMVLSVHNKDGRHESYRKELLQAIPG